MKRTRYLPSSKLPSVRPGRRRLTEARVRRSVQPKAWRAPVLRLTGIEPRRPVSDSRTA